MTNKIYNTLSWLENVNTPILDVFAGTLILFIGALIYIIVLLIVMPVLFVQDTIKSIYSYIIFKIDLAKERKERREVYASFRQMVKGVGVDNFREAARKVIK